MSVCSYYNYKVTFEILSRHILSKLLNKWIICRCEGSVVLLDSILHTGSLRTYFKLYVLHSSLQYLLLFSLPYCIVSVNISFGSRLGSSYEAPPESSSNGSRFSAPLRRPLASPTRESSWSNCSCPHEEKEGLVWDFGSKSNIIFCILCEEYFAYFVKMPQWYSSFNWGDGAGRGVN